MKHGLRLLLVASVAVVASACSSSTSDTPPGGSSGSSGVNPTGKTDDQFKQEIVTGMHDSILGDIDALAKAVAELQAAAPTPTGRGWDKTQDAAAIASMKAAWGRAREAYEHIEGAIAPIFPDIDAAIDQRYDGFLETLGAAGDADLFDDKGVTGMHAVERILWSDTIPAKVVDFEKSIPGYKAAAFPATEAEAKAFKEKLAAKLVADVNDLKAQWQPAKVDIQSAYVGLVGLMKEQLEKVKNASEGAEESRYSQRTLKDIRYNLDGTTKIYKVFSPWIVSKGTGSEIDKKVLAGFDRLNALYGGYQGDALPTPPDTWSAEKPSQQDLGTPFGKLYSGIKSEADPKADNSTVKAMNDAGALVGFREFKTE